VNKVLNKVYLTPLVLMVLLSGCGGKKKQKNRPTNKEMNTNVDIPVAGTGIKSFFDGDVDAFALAEEKGNVNSMNTNVDANMQKDDLSWVDDSSKGFNKVYFDYDRYSVREEQKDNLNANIGLAKKMIEESKFFGKAMPTIVIQGHACASAGSSIYNLALSEKRAKVLFDALVQAGIPQEGIKIVGRGSEMPAMIDGKPVSGSREEQWPNRRDEIGLIFG